MSLQRRDLLLTPFAWALPAWAQAPAEDDFAWLEEVDGPRARGWVDERNAELLALVGKDPDFARRRRETLAAISSPSNISFARRHGDWHYNFYRNATRPHGIWRRATVAEYAKERPSWQILLNMDDLAREEQRNIVFGGANVHAESGRALLFLSQGGEDKTELREFDINGRGFAPGGFRAPTAKMWVTWFGPDELLIATDMGPESLTASGYPMTLRRWKRGTPLADAPVVLRGAASDMQVSAESGARDGLPPAALLHRRVSFYQWERQLLVAGAAAVPVDLPRDAWSWIDGEWILMVLRTDWSGQAAGSVLAIPLAQATRTQRDIHVLFTGGPRRRSVRTERVKDGFVVASTDNLRPQLVFQRWDGTRFAAQPLPVPEVGELMIGNDSVREGNKVWLTTQAPLAPQKYSLVDAAQPAAAPAVVKSQAHFFDAAGLQVTQGEAKSADGTAIPYTVIAPAGASGPLPTLLYGYGGFGLTVPLDYQRLPGINWLQYGGVYVMAHIRGGGEFGPEWYEQAKGVKRQAAFDDFIAVARALVARGITQPKQLGIYGASNGGALVTAVMVQQPQLFGAVVSRVPLTDMLGFTKLFAGPSWVEEYGDPDKPTDRAILARWSPYQNALKFTPGGTAYPPILFIGNRNDDRVHPAHARKMVARMRALGHARTWLYEEASGGHLGTSDPQIWAQREALIYSFLRQQLAP